MCAFDHSFIERERDRTKEREGERETNTLTRTQIHFIYTKEIKHTKKCEYIEIGDTCKKREN